MDSDPWPICTCFLKSSTLYKKVKLLFDSREGKWSGEGVSLIVYDEGCPCVTCETNHMTNFAVLMAVEGVPVRLRESFLKKRSFKWAGWGI